MDIDGHDCRLVDDGTMDTVILIDGAEHRYAAEYAAECRDNDGTMTEDGFRHLCREIIEDLAHWSDEIGQ